MTLEEAAAHVSLFLIAAGSTTAFAALLADPRSPPRRVLAEHERRLARDLAFLRARAPAKFVVRAQILLVVAIVLGSWAEGTPALLSACVPLVVGPRLLLRRARLMRVQALEAGLDTWLLTLSNALRATASLGDALASTVRLVPPPMSEEVDRLVKEHCLGTPLPDALDAMAARIDSSAVRTALLTLKIARNTGGRLADTLETSASTLREMARLEGVVRAKTAEGKAQAVVVSSLPVPLVGVVHFLDPTFFAPLARTASGWLVVFGAAGLWIAAIVLAVKITAVDV
jgi:tight adherence protein B